MNARILMVAIIIGAMSASAETQTAQPAGAADNDSESACQKGRVDAENDIKNHRLALEIFGLPAPYFGDYAKLLLERYQIELKRVAGCVPDPQTIGHARGYNEIAMKEVEHRYGKDILEQARKEAEKHYQSSRPR